MNIGKFGVIPEVTEAVFIFLAFFPPTFQIVYFLLISYLFVCLCWVFVALGLFSICSERVLLSRCGAWASHWNDFSYSKLQALELFGFSSCGSVVVVRGLSCPSARGIFPDQGLNLYLPHWQVDSLPLGHQGSPVDFFLSSLILLPSQICC